MASNISNASDYDSGLSGREGFGYSGDTSDTSYVGDDPSGAEIGLADFFTPDSLSYMDSLGSGGRTGGRADFGVGYGRSSIPTAQNILANSGQPTFGDRGTALNMNEFMALKGISAADPFAGSKKFGFTDYMGGLDYRGQRDTIDDLQRQYAQYYNPYGQTGIGTVVPSKDSATGLDQTSLDALQRDFNRLNRNPNIQGDKEKGDLREGLQRGYGSIFGSNVGLPTFQGNVVDQDRQFGTGELVARGLASLAPGPIGTILSQVGKTKPTLDTSRTYKAELDPNSPDYEGPGYFGQLTNMLTGGAGTQIGDKISSEFDALVDGISFLNKPTNDKDLSSMTDSNYKGSAPASIVREDLTAPSINYSPNPMGAGENLGEAFNTGIANINPEVTDSAMQMQPEMDISKTTDSFATNFYGDLPTSTTSKRGPVTNPVIAIAMGIMRKEPETDFSSAMNKARMELAKRKFNEKRASTMNPT